MKKDERGESWVGSEKEKDRGVAGKRVPPPREISVPRPLQREGVAAQTLPKKNRRSRPGKAARAVPETRDALRERKKRVAGRARGSLAKRAGRERQMRTSGQRGRPFAPPEVALFLSPLR